MRGFAARSLSRFVFGVSAVALATSAQAQDSAAPAPGGDEDEIIVTGIRASLREAMEIKRSAFGVVDAISAEDIGKFPDTNLAESLQRITGVSIDRTNGEGQFVTVRGFGPEFNLITLNGRHMPSSGLGDGQSAPVSRSFDFANLASEAVSGVEVYKTGRAAVPSGGIGASINIRTPRPLDRTGFQATLGVKGVYDTSRNGSDTVTPEVSGLISNTFGDDTFGILLTGSYQRRKSSQNSFVAGWRDGYLGSENNWGSLAQPGDPRADNIINRPGDNDVYQVAQNGSYNIEDIDRERINGQLVLQFRPSDIFTATLDYTYSRNTVEVRNSNVGIWFNHGDTYSEWTDGPVAGPIFYSERFGASENKDLSYSGSLTANRSENKSFGANFALTPAGPLSFELDMHSSTAESKPTNKFGSSMSIGTAVFGVASQTLNFDNTLPVLSYTMHPGINPLDASLITPTGNAFRNAYFKDRIRQVQLRGKYKSDGGFIDSIDFGVSYSENKIRSAYGFIQNDTWGGAGPASDIPDDIFKLITIPDKFKGFSGSNDPDIVKSFYGFDFERMAGLLDDLYGVCGGDGDCLADYTVDRRITEKTLSPYAQINGQFSAFGRPGHIIAGLRYDQTTVDSSALVPIPVSTFWGGDNEISIVFSDQSDFTRFKGHYQNWLPSIDFDIEPMENLKLRASYSHTITRADYGNLQGGQTLDQLVRIASGTGSRGNPGLVPYKSKNIDFSAEWYYQPSSYVSVGYFRKRVSNFIGTSRVDTNAFDLRNPASGPRQRAALAALGPNATISAIRQYIFNNFPDSVVITSTDSNGIHSGRILALPEDDLINFQITIPVNSDQTATLKGWEFAVQHSFWDTGFGVILNYTKVDGSAKYDPSKPSSVTQFALTGLSDSANAVAFYDKNGLQARVAYNWRDKFLATTGPNPVYVDDYSQLDASASYEFLPGFTGFVEGINLLGKGYRKYHRSIRNITFAAPGDARFAAGIRYKF